MKRVNLTSCRLPQRRSVATKHDFFCTINYLTLSGCARTYLFATCAQARRLPYSPHRWRIKRVTWPDERQKYNCVYNNNICSRGFFFLITNGLRAQMGCQNKISPGRLKVEQYQYKVAGEVEEVDST